MSKRLIDAIYEQDQAKVAALLAKGLDPNRAYEGLLPLVEACQKSTTGIVGELLHRGAAVNQVDEIARHSPLTAACDAGNFATVKLLVSHGANVNYARKNISTPLTEAASRRDKRRLAIVNFLLDAGADPKAVFYSQDGVAVSNVLMSASYSAAPEIIEALIKAGAPVNQTLFFGTAIICAVEEGRDDIVEVLLRHGADPRIAAPNDPKLLEMAGKNAIELAAHKKMKKIMSILERFQMKNKTVHQ
jgi:ankyrin repeat protein